MGCRLLKMGWLTWWRASVEGKGVRKTDPAGSLRSTADSQERGRKKANAETLRAPRPGRGKRRLGMEAWRGASCSAWKTICCPTLAICGWVREFSIILGEQRGEELLIGGSWFEAGVCAGLAVAAEHEIAEMSQEAGFGGREETLGDGNGKLGEDAADFVRGNQGATRGDEFAGEIGWAEAAVRSVCMRVAEAFALRVGGEGAAASIGESKLAASVCGFGVFRSHAGRIIYCVYSCLVTGSYMQFRIAGGSVRMGAEAFQKGSKGNPKTQVPKVGTWGTRLRELKSSEVQELKS
jgi:hypothetical protein